MLYLVQSGEYTKIGYAENFQRRFNNYVSTNPNIKVLGVKEGTLEDEYKYHLKYTQYIVIPKSEWMILPMEELIKLSREFNKPNGIYLSVNDKYRIKNKIINIEKGIESKDTYNEDIPYEVAKKELLEAPVVSTRVNTYVFQKKVTPNNEIINTYKEIVQNRIRNYIVVPIATIKVKTFLKELYKELGINLYARATDVVNIWLPSEYKRGLLTYNEIQAPYIIPINFKDKKSTSKRPLKVTFSDGTDKIYSSITEAAKELNLDKNMLWYNIRKHKHTITEYTFELVD